MRKDPGRQPGADIPAGKAGAGKTAWGDGGTVGGKLLQRAFLTSWKQPCQAANVIKLRKRVLDAMYEESKTLFANIFVNLSKKVLTNQEKCAAVFANSENGPCN